MSTQYITISRVPMWLFSELTKRARDYDLNIAEFTGQILVHACANRDAYDAAAAPISKDSGEYKGSLSIAADKDMKRQVENWGQNGPKRSLNKQTLYILKKYLSLDVQFNDLYPLKSVEN